jgi:nitrile hydratase subunit beta
MRGYHDIGGLNAGPVDQSQHDYALWEKRVDAMLVLLSAKKLITTDELRLGIETLGADAYERLSYYERWIASIARALVARGVITTDELGRRMAEASQRPRDAA